MNRQFFIDLADSGHAVPIGTDLVLHEKSDHDSIPYDGIGLGKVIEESASRYNTPLAIPLMDLKIEKSVMLEAMGIPENEIETFHFTAAPPAELIGAIGKKVTESANSRLIATCSSIRYIAENTGLLPMGMCIGPFSLLTKLMSDPITAVYMKGAGAAYAGEPSIRIIDGLLALSVQVIVHYLKRQIDSGARAIIMCEPAANKIFFSPKQIRQGSDIFDRCVIDHDGIIKDFLDRAGVDLIFHDCGELDDAMITRFASLNPSMMSLGGSRNLWEDARLIPKSIVIYGNMPTKLFYSDELISVEEAAAQARDLADRMREIGHPFILGSECDVLSVPGREDVIKKKVTAFLGCACSGSPAGER